MSGGQTGARKLEYSYFMQQRLKNLERCTQPEYQGALRLRQIWYEGTFAIQKRCHNLAQLLQRKGGSGGPLPPFRRGIKPQKIDTERRLTPKGVFSFFLTRFAYANEVLC